jgi:hypothetical protein
MVVARVAGIAFLLLKISGGKLACAKQVVKVQGVRLYEMPKGARVYARLQVQSSL